MRRTAAPKASVLAVSLAAALAACSTTPEREERTPLAWKAGDAPPAAPPPRQATGKSTGLARVGGYALAVPENVIWIPWKLIGTAGKGLADGVGAGFREGRMPAYGVLFLPINAAAGLVTGLVEGAAMPPMLVGPDDNFGRTLGKPPAHATSVWWYGDR